MGVDAALDYDGIGILISGKGMVRRFRYLIGFSKGVYVGRSEKQSFS